MCASACVLRTRRVCAAACLVRVSVCLLGGRGEVETLSVLLVGGGGARIFRGCHCAKLPAKVLFDPSSPDSTRFELITP